MSRVCEHAYSGGRDGRSGACSVSGGQPNFTSSLKMADPVRFLHAIEKLKTTKRTGWIERGINGAESISDHMYRMSIMAMIVKDPALDKNRCIQMALVHDLAESIAGDITPHAPITKQEKYKLEDDAFKELCGMLGNSAESQLMYELWQEYEDASTPEAKLVKDLDKFEV